MSQSDANGTAPTLEQEMAAFKSYATTDGAISAGEETQEERDAETQRRAADEAAKQAAEVAAKAAGEGVAEADETAEKSPEEATIEEKVAAQVKAASEPTKKSKKTAAERQAEIQNQISESIRQLRETERRIQDAEERLKAAETGRLSGKTATTAPKPSETGDAPPNPADFEFGELDSRFIDAKVQYGIKQALASHTKAQEEAAKKAKEEAQRAETAKQVRDFSSKGAEKYDDFEETVMQPAMAGLYPVSEVIGHLTLTSPCGIDVAYYLATHRNEAREIAGKSPLEQAAYFGRLEALFTAQSSGARAGKPAQTTKAPPPLTQVVRGGGGRTQTPPDTSDFASFERMAMGGR